jgi:hypothetical protein
MNLQQKNGASGWPAGVDGYERGHAARTMDGSKILPKGDIKCLKSRIRVFWSPGHWCYRRLYDRRPDEVRRLDPRHRPQGR